MAIRKEYDNAFLVGTNDCKLAEELNLERVDKYGYEEKVEKDKIEIVMEKTKIYFD